MAKKNKVLTAEEIKSKLDDFKAEIEDSAENKKNRVSPTQEFLNEIKEVIQIGIDKDVSYPQIVKDIYKVFGFKTSTQTLRAFAINELGVIPKKRESKKDTELPKTSLEMKQEMAKKKDDEDTL